MQILSGLSLEEIENITSSFGASKYRAKQIHNWIYTKSVSSFDEMTDISVNLRNKLSEVSYISTLKIVRKLESKIDKTKKYLFELEDGNYVESVVMYYKHGITICISCQVGCRMGCRFCASTLDGLERNLEVYEMLEEVYRIQAITGEKVSNIVLMGSG